MVLGSDVMNTNEYCFGEASSSIEKFLGLQSNGAKKQTFASVSTGGMIISPMRTIKSLSSNVAGDAQVSSIFSDQLSPEQEAKLKELQKLTGAGNIPTFPAANSPSSSRTAGNSLASMMASRFLMSSSPVQSSKALPSKQQDRTRPPTRSPSKQEVVSSPKSKSGRRRSVMCPSLKERELYEEEDDIAHSSTKVISRARAGRTKQSVGTLPFGFQAKSANGLLDNIRTSPLQSMELKNRYTQRQSWPSLILENSEWKAEDDLESTTIGRLEKAPVGDDQLAAMKLLLLGDSSTIGVSTNSGTDKKKSAKLKKLGSPHQSRVRKNRSSAPELLLVPSSSVVPPPPPPEMKGSRWQATTPPAFAARDRKKRLPSPNPSGGRGDWERGIIAPPQVVLDQSPLLQAGVMVNSSYYHGVNSRRWAGSGGDAPPRTSSSSPKSDVSLMLSRDKLVDDKIPSIASSRWWSEDASSCRLASPSSPWRKLSLHGESKSCPGLQELEYSLVGSSQRCPRRLPECDDEELMERRNQPLSIKSSARRCIGQQQQQEASLGSVLASPEALALQALMKSQDDKSTSVKMLRKGKGSGASSLGQLRRSGQSISSMLNKKNNDGGEENETHLSSCCLLQNSDWSSSSPEDASRNDAFLKKKNMFDAIIRAKVDGAGGKSASSSLSRPMPSNSSVRSTRMVISKGAKMQLY